MNGRVYDPLTGMFFSPDPYVQAPGDWLNYNRYGYCLNNPLLYTDPNGEWYVWDDLTAFAVGGLINWVSNGCQFNKEGLSYFVVGGISGLATYYAPGAYSYIGAATSAANSTIRQGFNGDNTWNWNDVNGKKVFCDGAIGGLTSYASGALGNKISSSTDNLLKNIHSPILKNVIASEMVGIPMGGMLGGVGALGDNDPKTTFWSGVWSGTKQAFVTSGISGFGNAIRYSNDNHVNLWTGKSTLVDGWPAPPTDGPFKVGDPSRQKPLMRG